MKHLNLVLRILFVLFTISLASCKSVAFYQVYKAVPDNNVSVTSENQMEYEDKNCMISYNLWSDGGNMGFKVFNKTDKDLIVNLDKSFFIRNGEAYSYYQNRIFTHSSSHGLAKSKSASAAKSAQVSNSTAGLDFWGFLSSASSSVAGSISATSSTGHMTSSGQSVAYTEEVQVVIPPRTSKSFYEYNVVDGVYRNCDLLLFPKRKDIKTQLFSKNNSPYIFSNVIAYSLENQEEINIIENEFYISEVTNYPEKEIFEEVDITDCDIKNTFSSSKSKAYYFKRDKITPEGFYFKYVDFRK